MQSGGARQQIKSLENETDFFVTDAGKLVVVEFADQMTVELVISFAWRIEAADQVHQRRFA